MSGLFWWIIALAIATIAFAILDFGVLAGTALWVLRILYAVFLIISIFVFIRDTASRRAGQNQSEKMANETKDILDKP